MTKPTLSWNFLPAWLVVLSFITYWGAVALSGWDFTGIDTNRIYPLIVALLPAFVLQLSGLSLYILAFKQHAVDFKMPNYWIAFIGSLAIIQFLIIGLFLTGRIISAIGDLGVLCPHYPNIPRCDISRNVYGPSFLMIQNGLWLPLGIVSLKASTSAIPPN